MKKQQLLTTALAVFFAAALVCTCGLTAFAEELTLDADNLQKEIGVYVKYVDNTGRNIVKTDESGKGSATLPDGTVVEVSGADGNKGTLVIDPITENAALEWIGEVTEGELKSPQAFHIYYIDGNGGISKADGVAVTIKTDLPSNAAVCSLNPDGEVTLLEHTASDGELSFTVNGDPYYVVGDSSGKVPPTGDNDRTALWIALLLASGALFAAAAYTEKKRHI